MNESGGDEDLKLASIWDMSKSTKKPMSIGLICTNRLAELQQILES